MLEALRLAFTAFSPRLLNVEGHTLPPAQKPLGQDGGGAGEEDAAQKAENAQMRPQEMAFSAPIRWPEVEQSYLCEGGHGGRH